MQNYCYTFLFAFNKFIMKKEDIKNNCIELDNLYKILVPIITEKNIYHQNNSDMSNWWQLKKQLKAINDRKQDYVLSVLFKKKLRQMFIIEMTKFQNKNLKLEFIKFVINKYKKYT